MPVDLKDWDLHHRPCELATLLNALTELQAKLPGALVGRSGHGTGNLCVYDQDGNYLGVVTLGSRPELDLFADDEADDAQP